MKTRARISLAASVALSAALMLVLPAGAQTTTPYLNKAMEDQAELNRIMVEGQPKKTLTINPFPKGARAASPKPKPLLPPEYRAEDEIFSGKTAEEKAEAVLHHHPKEKIELLETKVVIETALPKDMRKDMPKDMPKDMAEPGQDEPEASAIENPETPVQKLAREIKKDRYQPINMTIVEAVEQEQEAVMERTMMQDIAAEMGGKQSLGRVFEPSVTAQEHAPCPPEITPQKQVKKRERIRPVETMVAEAQEAPTQLVTQEVTVIEAKPVATMNEEIIWNSVPDIKRWRALRGTELKSLLELWARQGGMNFIWDSNRAFIVKETFSIKTNYQQAILNVLAQYEGDAIRPYGRIYRDPETRGSVLVIRDTRQNSDE